MSDHDRPLAPRGRRAARRMAEYFESQALRPSLVLCSSALRARETLDLLRPALGTHIVLRVEDGLYGATASELLERLRDVDADVDELLLIGHNPGLQDLAVELAGDAAGDAMQQLRVKFPTGALAALDVGHTAWTDLSTGCASLMKLVLPRALVGR